MWSDRVSPQRGRQLRDELQALLPPHGHRSTPGVVREPASAAQIEQWQSEPGFTMLRDAQGPFALHQPLATISYHDGFATVQAAGTTKKLRAPAFDILEAARDAWGGTGTMLAGYLAYDLAAELENLGEPPENDLGLPSLYLGLYETIYEVRDWNPEKHTLASVAGPLRSTPDKAGFEASVVEIVRTIHAGDIFQTNLCRRIETEFDPADAWSLFHRLSAINPARYAAFIRLSETEVVLSASPEQFLKVRGGQVESSPIKGTRPRGETPEADAALLKELQSSEKDRAELAMIVDVVRNDLGRVCRTGSVQVEAHAQLMELPTVHHLYSTVIGRLRADSSYVDLLRAAFPPASISGAPKIEAMYVAQREEKQLRGPAMGAIGWMVDGAMELSVAIRTAFINGGKVRYYAGCGITADSDPAAEYQESYHKAAAFVRALTEDQPQPAPAAVLSEAESEA